MKKPSIKISRKKMIGHEKVEYQLKKEWILE